MQEKRKSFLFCEHESV